MVHLHSCCTAVLGALQWQTASILATCANRTDGSWRWLRSVAVMVHDIAQWLCPWRDCPWKMTGAVRAANRGDTTARLRGKSLVMTVCVARTGSVSAQPPVVAFSALAQRDGFLFVFSLWSNLQVCFFPLWSKLQFLFCFSLWPNLQFFLFFSFSFSLWPSLLLFFPLWPNLLGFCFFALAQPPVFKKFLYHSGPNSWFFFPVWPNLLGFCLFFRSGPASWCFFPHSGPTSWDFSHSVTTSTEPL